MKDPIFLLLFLLALNGCSFTQKSYSAQYCHREGAYKKGYNDAQSGLPRDKRVSEPCFGSDRKNLVEKAYLDGFEAFAACHNPTLDKSARPIKCL